MSLQYALIRRRGFFVRPRELGGIALLGAVALCGNFARASQESKRISDLNDEFVKHAQQLTGEQRKAVEVVVKNREKYRGDEAESFVPDSLALLFTQFRDATAAFDDERYADVPKLLEPMLDKQADPYLRANALYYYARSLTERGMLEEAEKVLAEAVIADAKLETLTPYVAHLWFMKGFSQAANLRFDAAADALRTVAGFADAPEPVLAGAKQLLLEVERREVGTLDEVAGLMTYASGRLRVADASSKTRDRQDQAVALLDKLIDQAEQQEKQSSSSSGGKSGKKRGAARKPSNPAQQSDTPGGAGQIGDLHDPGKADPGEMWGKLPPAERERILQSLRNRFPSRYRELVEQYYRSLAEEK